MEKIIEQPTHLWLAWIHKETGETHLKSYKILNDPTDATMYRIEAPIWYGSDSTYYWGNHNMNKWYLTHNNKCEGYMTSDETEAKRELKNKINQVLKKKLEEFRSLQETINNLKKSLEEIENE